jgi:hypothetical protein
MAATRLNEMGRWNPDAIERQLAHQEANAVRRFAYNLGVSYSKEQRARQQAFNRGLKALLSEGAVGIWEDYVWPIC